jgi:DNA polymerase-1
VVVLKNQKLILIDGNSLLFRAFYALPLLHTSQGIHTNAVYGFMTMLRRLLLEEKPSHIMVAFDKGKKTFRNEIFTDYKGTRSETPIELQEQFLLIREILEALNIPFLEKEGYEADDIIGTLSRQADEEKIECIIVTGDRDALQLVSPNTRVYLNRKGISDIDTYDGDMVKEKCGVTPEQMVELKALMGDSSDNIPGVMGVGPKTGAKLINEYDNLENIYAHLQDIKGKKLKENLANCREQAFMSRELAAIIRDIELPAGIADFVRKAPNKQSLRELYRRLEFRNFLEDLENELFEDGDKELSAPADIEVTELNNESALQEFLARFKTISAMGIYIETTYHHPMWAKITNMWLEIEEQIACYKLGEEQELLPGIRALLANAEIDKYLYNAKSNQVILKRYGVGLQGIKGDLMLLTYVLDPSFTGEDLASTLAYYKEARDYEPAEMISLLRELFLERYGELSFELRALLDKMEMPISNILAEMEFHGIKIDRDILQQMAEELGNKILVDEEQIYAMAGQRFNINSPKQLGKVLFEDLQLPVIKKTKTGYATGAEILEQLVGQHEIISYLLEYRQLAKLKSTYVDALPALIHPETGRVHTIFKQALTATGRLSSVEPNLQNIPIKMEAGRRIRKAFVPEGENKYILSADYSQIDLRALAHISGDKNLIETFHAGVDVHTRTAAEIFKVPLEEVTEDLRRRAKAVNFGIIYGISDFGLARDTGVSRKEAGSYIKEYLRSYPGVQAYMDDIVAKGKKYGYVETIFSRRRYLPELNSPRKMQQAFARRMALNTPIQGTSADIIKMAMIKVNEEIKKSDLQAQMVLQVHDELLFVVDKKDLMRLARLVKDCMENACELKVPLVASLQCGCNWYEMQDLEIE